MWVSAGDDFQLAWFRPPSSWGYSYGNSPASFFARPKAKALAFAQGAVSAATGHRLKGILGEDSVMNLREIAHRFYATSTVVVGGTTGLPATYTNILDELFYICSKYLYHRGGMRHKLWVTSANGSLNTLMAWRDSYDIGSCGTAVQSTSSNPFLEWETPYLSAYIAQPNTTFYNYSSDHPVS